MTPSGRSPSCGLRMSSPICSDIFRPEAAPCWRLQQSMVRHACRVEAKRDASQWLTIAPSRSVRGSMSWASRWTEQGRRWSFHSPGNKQPHGCDSTTTGAFAACASCCLQPAASIPVRRSGMDVVHRALASGSRLGGNMVACHNPFQRRSEHPLAHVGPGGHPYRSESGDVT